MIEAEEKLITRWTGDIQRFSRLVELSFSEETLGRIIVAQPGLSHLTHGAK
jgi:hypothetical protein